MAGYIGTTPVPQATQHRESFTATGGQTSFATVGYTPQFIDVYLNGVKLAPADFTATNGSDVVLASGATASDILEIVAYTPFEVANQTFTGTTTAANLTVTGAFTSQGIDDNADAVAITIDSSENVGIGTSSPSQKLDVNGSVNIPNDYSYGFGGAGSNTYISGNNASNNLRFNTNGSERMRIDSSGNLLVGKTTNGSTVTGCELREEGFVIASMDGDHAAVFDRKTSDGVIVQLRKDNSTVGLIASNGGAISIGSDDVGVYFDAGSDRILPMNASTNAVRNDAIDLGGNPHRFKDLYLSGGVYLGGTGSANKLDDYEEGTWTPTISSGTFTAENAWYVKVGTLITISAKLSGFSDTSSGNSVTVGGVPFTTKASDHTAQGSMIADYLSNGPYFPYISSNATTIRFYIQSTTTYTTMLHSNLGSSGSFYFTLTYQTQ